MCQRKTGSPMSLCSELWCFSHSGGCTAVRIRWKLCLLKNVLTYIFMVKWDKGFEGREQNTFRKEYLGKLNIMKLICVALSMQILVLKFGKSQVRRDMGWEWNWGVAPFKRWLIRRALKGCRERLSRGVWGGSVDCGVWHTWDPNRVNQLG